MAKERLRKYAEEIGAVSANGRVNWRAVAETLAEIAKPELLESEPRRPVGRSRLTGDYGDDCWLTIEIDYVKTTDNLTVIQACKQISKNKFIRFLLQFKPVTLPNPWVGTEPETLRGRYQRWLKAEKKRQQEMALEIRDYRPYDPEVARNLDQAVSDLDGLIKK